EKIERLRANLLWLQVDGSPVDWRLAGCVRFDKISAKCARLERGEPGTSAQERHIRRRLTLKHLPDEDQLASFVAIAHAIADHPFAERGGQLRREVADLIGMRKENQIGPGGFDDLFERDAVAIGGVSVQQVVLDENNLGNTFRR